MTSLLAFALSLALPSNAAPPLDPGCTFERGTTTCVIVSQEEQHETITMYSGCMYGPHGVPGRRERVFDETFLLTATTTTLAHGRSGPVYDFWTTVTREMVSMTLISDTCYPL